MHISEVKEGTELTVTAEMGSEKIEFKTAACFNIDDTLVVNEIVTEDGQPVSLLSDNVFLSVSCINDRQVPIIWKNVLIKHITLNGNEYHRIAQAENGKVSNRRGAFRVHIDRIAMLQKGFNRPAIEVILRDISTSGFSIVTPEELEVGDTQPVHLVCDVEGYNINVLGQIVRRQPVDNSTRSIYGCKIMKFDKSLDKFIVSFQRERMKVQKLSPTLRNPQGEDTVS